eukprot:63565-Rhodomonas_salina.5
MAVQIVLKYGGAPLLGGAHHLKGNLLRRIHFQQPQHHAATSVLISDNAACCRAPGLLALRFLLLSFSCAAQARIADFCCVKMSTAADPGENLRGCGFGLAVNFSFVSWLCVLRFVLSISLLKTVMT